MDGWLTEQPDDDEAKLRIRYASQLVRKATRLDLYEVDPAGLPLDLDVAEAFRDATCAQVAMWFGAGIDPAAGTAGRTIGILSQSADGGSVTYADSVSAEEVMASLTGLVPVALDILRNAGLASTRPCTW
ncbi:hypothetical protein [Nocardia brasiliensis]|uniref:hypothetical protein n=1 Tax=Nocardia brasiliensis TaxID=37326 RepID=UPI002453B705|nr:hypothetical protein [Nocardia brasiliensis]